MSNFKLASSFGEEVTTEARDKAYETSDPSAGILHLMEICIGMTSDQAKEIIEGKKKLVTVNNELDFVDDNWTPPDFESMKKEIMKFISGEYERKLYASKGGYSEQDIFHGRSRRFDIELDAENQATRQELIELMKISIPKAYNLYKTLKFAIDKKLENQNKKPILTSLDRKILLYNSVQSSKNFETETDKRCKQAEIFGNIERANDYGESCNDERCRYYKGEICTFEYRKTYGCYANPEVKNRIDELEMCKEFLPATYINRVGKTYEFEFRNHFFKMENSARDQRECPFCYNGNEKEFIDPFEDCYVIGHDNPENKEFCFLGYKFFDDMHYAACFKCLKCGEYFYYHTELIDPYLLEKYPEVVEQ